jgi:hypothetical protein
MPRTPGSKRGLHTHDDNTWPEHCLGIVQVPVMTLQLINHVLLRGSTNLRTIGFVCFLCTKTLHKNTLLCNFAKTGDGEAFFFF